MAHIYLEDEFKRMDVVEVIKKSSSSDALHGQNCGTRVVQAKIIFFERAALEAVMGPIAQERWLFLGKQARGCTICCHMKFIKAKGMVPVC